MIARLPRILFVLGKGGVGRTTIATSLGTMLARRGDNVLVFEWTLSEVIAPWFGLPPAGIEPCRVSPGLSVANFRLEDSLRAYFVGHLHMGAFYRHVVNGRSIRRLIEATPGIAEMMFLGHLCWLTTIAESETGVHFDHVVVDMPATGHGSSLLDLAATLASMHATGFLGAEIARVEQMMADPTWTGAVVAALPNELAVEETLELVPRATKSLGRPPLVVLVNRSASRMVEGEVRPAWLAALSARMPPEVATALDGLHEELVRRVRFEGELRRALAGKTPWGAFALDEQLAVGGDRTPRAIATALAGPIESIFTRGA